MVNLVFTTMLIESLKLSSHFYSFMEVFVELTQLLFPMEIQLLKDSEVAPSHQVLKSALCDAFSPYVELMKYVSADGSGMSADWQYYKDGKAWLCKVSHKKKTVCWLSVWEGFFKLGFYFTAKTGPGVGDLKISDCIKDGFKNATQIGKLWPLVVNVSGLEQLPDVFSVMEYKKGLK